jgi:tRNA A-37 threonylcarbamoyl transferase component Bud32
MMESKPRERTPRRPAPAGGSPRPTGSDEGFPNPLPPPNEAAEAESLGATQVVAGSIRAEPDTACIAAAPTSLAGPASGQRVSSQVGDFRLLRKLGQGAMAAVYKARQVSFKRDVALKILFKHVADNPKLVERFYREARITGRLDHPNIVRGYGVGEFDGLHYFAMEYVDGHSLQKWLLRLGRLSVGDAVHVTLACARALQYAHSLDLIHRDVKPDNVLITKSGEVKLADLGMVKLLDEDLSLTQTGHAVGTPWYMPLEQARNSKETDGRCDIYALGCMFYHLLVGKPPFVGPTLVDLIREKEAGTFPPARQVNPDVPERLDLILAKMAAKQPRHRHQNCADVISDLEALGLAAPSLGFLAQPLASTAKAEAPGPTASDAEEPTPAPALREALADAWDVRYRSAAGKTVERRLSAAEIVKMIELGLLGPTAQASRRAGNNFRALATYREFEPAMLGQATKKAADRHTVRYRNLYKKIEEEDRRRELSDSKDAEAVAGNYAYWLGMTLKIGLPLAGLAGAIWFLRWAAHVIGD